MNFLYYPGKANVVVDALSLMTMGSVSHVEEAMKDLVKDVHRLARFGVRFENSPNSSFMVYKNSESSMVVEVKSKQHLDRPLMEFKEEVLGKLNESFSLGRDGVFRYQGRLCIPNVHDLKNRIIEQDHGSRYSIHPGSKKMFHELREVFLVGRLKRT